MTIGINLYKENEIHALPHDKMVQASYTMVNVLAHDDRMFSLAVKTYCG